VSAKIQAMFATAAKDLADEATPLARRVDAARLLAYASADTASALAAVLTPQSAPELQIAAVRSLSAQDHPGVAGHLLKPWPQLGPSARREVVEQHLAVPARTGQFLDAIEQGQVRSAEIEPARIAQLKAHPTATIRKRAEALFAGQGGADRKKVIDDYAAALTLTGDPAKGKAAFKQHCAACHKLGDEGHDVGPSLLAVVPGKSGEDLLTALLDPNREVDPRYLNYQANTADGRVLTGVVTAETSAAVTLRRSDGVEETVRRADLDSLKSTGLSLMPEGLEQTVSKQDVADLLAFLRHAVAAKK
jgi:putative heme-binding domain-containing protein